MQAGNGAKKGGADSELMSPLASPPATGVDLFNDSLEAGSLSELESRNSLHASKPLELSGRDNSLSRESLMSTGSRHSVKIVRHLTPFWLR